VATITFFAPAGPQWTWREQNVLSTLCHTLGNESPFGWCDVATAAGPEGPVAQFCDHFGPVVRLKRAGRRYEVTCLRSDISNRTTKLKRAVELVRIRWNLRAYADPDRLHRHAG
jgi:hypothetical protein